MRWMLLLLVGGVVSAGLAPTVGRAAEVDAELASLVAGLRHGERAERALFSASALPSALDPLCGASVLAQLLVLDRDVSCEAAGCLSLGEGAILDLGGFAYTGCIVGSDGVTVRNGVVLGGPIFPDGDCEDCLIDRVDVIGGGDFVVQIGSRSVIRDSRFSGNDVAVDLYYGDPEDVAIVGCEFEDNVTAVNLAASNRSRLESNAFHGNRIGFHLWNEDGFAGNDHTFSDNEFVDNDYGGVVNATECEDGDGACLVRNRFVDNLVRDNLDQGLVVCAEGVADGGCEAMEIRIEENRFEGNGFGPTASGGDGLLVDGPPELHGGIRVARNVAVGNADLGIEAPGVLDGGGNRARDNGNPLQCTGVVCEGLVDVDVKPGRRRARINPLSRGVVSVALLGSDSFDVATVEIGTLAFGPAGAGVKRVRARGPRDLNRDGAPDLVLVFRTREAGIAFGADQACLSGATLDGTRFGGCDAISTVPGCHGDPEGRPCDRKGASSTRR